uniref:Uncharacterized protein n=1 Tax=Neogobius melanostomus TaxID=47308 RepID=A0A8C6UT20_9GOBI
MATLNFSSRSCFWWEQFESNTTGFFQGEYFNYTTLWLGLGLAIIHTQISKHIVWRVYSLYSSGWVYSSSHDLYKQDSGIALLTVNNPSRMNAFSGSMMVDLEARVTELENWSDGKGLIVHGVADTFCSGSDLNVVRAIANPQDGMKMCMFMQNTLTRLHSCSCGGKGSGRRSRACDRL